MRTNTSFGRKWPGWLKVVFKISGSLFIVSLFLVFFAWAYGRVSFLEAPPINPDHAKDFATYSTEITGFITALTALYGQIHTARKENAELEIEKKKLELELQKNASKKKRKLPAKK